ncbi:MAG: hypothetical protein V9G20_18390 [Candidatus Promineifilaceae bacterium]
MTPQVLIPIRVSSLACGAAKPTVFPLSVAIFVGVPHGPTAHQARPELAEEMNENDATSSHSHPCFFLSLRRGEAYRVSTIRGYFRRSSP